MLLHAILSLVVATLIGMVWYSPSVFGTTWMRLTYPGKRFEDLGGTTSKILSSWVGAVMIAICVFTCLQTFLRVRTLQDTLRGAAMMSAVVWGTQVAHTAYEEQAWPLYFVNCGFDTAVIFSSSMVYHFLGY